MTPREQAQFKLEFLYAAGTEISIRYQVNMIEDAIDDDDFELLNEIFGLADINKLDRHSVNLLRGAYRVRDRIPNWTVFGRKVQAYLSITDRGHIMRGLHECL